MNPQGSPHSSGKSQEIAETHLHGAIPAAIVLRGMLENSTIPRCFFDRKSADDYTLGVRIPLSQFYNQAPDFKISFPVRGLTWSLRATVHETQIGTPPYVELTTDANVPDPNLRRELFIRGVNQLFEEFGKKGGHDVATKLPLRIPLSLNEAAHGIQFGLINSDQDPVFYREALQVGFLLRTEARPFKPSELAIRRLVNEMGLQCDLLQLGDHRYLRIYHAVDKARAGSTLVPKLLEIKLRKMEDMVAKHHSLLAWKEQDSL